MHLHHDRNIRSLSFRSKYKTVGALLSARCGERPCTVLDIGARDQVLRRFLPPSIVYKSADVSPGCDYTVDLENPLAFPDDAFDYVVALDVLEHVDQFHAAANDLCRIAARGVVIGLPNMGFIGARFSYLFSGKLGTDKYDLTPEPPGDRHRWVTEYRCVNQTMDALAQRHEAVSVSATDEVGSSTLSRALLYPIARLSLVPLAIATGRTIHLISFVD